MLWVELAIAAAVLGGVALLAGGRGGGLPRAWADRPDPLPQRPWDAGALERLRFGVGFRGYRMDQVDEALDQIAAELASRDARIAALEAGGLGSRDVAAGGFSSMPTEPIADTPAP